MLKDDPKLRKEELNFIEVKMKPPRRLGGIEHPRNGIKRIAFHNQRCLKLDLLVNLWKAVYIYSLYCYYLKCCMLFYTIFGKLQYHLGTIYIFYIHSDMIISLIFVYINEKREALQTVAFMCCSKY